MACLQVVVGRQGDQLLTSEAGDVTRWASIVVRYLMLLHAAKYSTGSQLTCVQVPPSRVQVLRMRCFMSTCPSPLTIRIPLCCRSHLQGMFFRTVRMLEAGMKPV